MEPLHILSDAQQRWSRRRAIKEPFMYWDWGIKLTSLSKESLRNISIASFVIGILLVLLNVVTLAVWMPIAPFAQFFQGFWFGGLVLITSAATLNASRCCRLDAVLISFLITLFVSIIWALFFVLACVACSDHTNVWTDSAGDLSDLSDPLGTVKGAILIMDGLTLTAGVLQLVLLLWSLVIMSLVLWFSDWPRHTNIESNIRNDVTETVFNNAMGEELSNQQGFYTSFGRSFHATNFSIVRHERNAPTRNSGINAGAPEQRGGHLRASKALASTVPRKANELADPSLLCKWKAKLSTTAEKGMRAVDQALVISRFVAQQNQMIEAQTRLRDSSEQVRRLYERRSRDIFRDASLSDSRTSQTDSLH